MNVFEDLIDELKDENLLEASIFDFAAAGNGGVAVAVVSSSNGPKAITEFEIERGDLGSDDVEPVLRPAEQRNGVDTSLKAADEAEFYRKRAKSEVASLQMVEHIITAIERENRKPASALFDDLKTKKALHVFLQVSDDMQSPEYAEAEYALLHETERWASALARRDEGISVADLRQFCETSRPPLSSQALIALARYYRNSKFSESTRAKFEFVMTRLFSKDVDGEKRELLFGRTEMIGHVRRLYGNWTSVTLIAEAEFEFEIRAAVDWFAEKASEAESAESFEALLKADFFNQLHEQKESIGEVFYMAEVTVAAIVCNIRLGNRLVDLFCDESLRTNIESIEEESGNLLSQIISGACGRTLQIREIIKTVPESENRGADVPPSPARRQRTAPSAPRHARDGRNSPSRSAPRVNKWLLAGTILAVLASGAVYFWSGGYSPAGIDSAVSAKQIAITNPELAQYLKMGRASDTTLYAITQPAWDELPEDKRKELVRKTLLLAAETNLKRVQLLNAKGRTVAFASSGKIEVLKP